MVRIRLFLLKSQVAPDSTIADAEHLRKISKEKMPEFIKWFSRFRVNREAYTEAQWINICETFGFRSIEELHGAQRFANVILLTGPEIDQSELRSDLSTLGFEQEKIDLIIDHFESVWLELDNYLRGMRLEAIPVLSSLRWRVDIRSASSNYLKEPEAIGLLRIGTNDGTRRNQIYIELDKDDLSRLETEIGKMKREFLKVEEKLKQTI